MPQTKHIVVALGLAGIAFYLYSLYKKQAPVTTTPSTPMQVAATGPSPAASTDNLTTHTDGGFQAP